MSLIKKEIEVSSAGDALGAAIGNIMTATATALKDGWQPGQDLPAIATVALTSLLGAAAELKNIATDAKATPFKFGKGVMNPILDGIEALVTK